MGFVPSSRGSLLEPKFLLPTPNKSFLLADPALRPGHTSIPDSPPLPFWVPLSAHDSIRSHPVFITSSLHPPPGTNHVLFFHISNFHPFPSSLSTTTTTQARHWFSAKSLAGSCLQLLLWPCPAHGWDSHPLQALEATPGPSSFPGDILLLGLYLLHSPPQFPPMSQVQVSISPNESKERTEPPTSDPP